jgi:hypothetical protein
MKAQAWLALRALADDQQERLATAITLVTSDPSHRGLVSPARVWSVAGVKMPFPKVMPLRRPPAPQHRAQVARRALERDAAEDGSPRTTCYLFDHGHRAAVLIAADQHAAGFFPSRVASERQGAG